MCWSTLGLIILRTAMTLGAAPPSQCPEKGPDREGLSALDKGPAASRPGSSLWLVCRWVQNRDGFTGGFSRHCSTGVALSPRDGAWAEMAWQCHRPTGWGAGTSAGL